MKLLHVQSGPSPDDPALVRRTGMVAPDSGPTLPIWFDVPAALAAELSPRADPWLLAMLPHALETGEPVRSELPADPALLENLRGLTAVWHTWYPWLRRPSIEAPAAAPAVTEAGRVGAFFSGGVDSWFTALRHVPEREPAAIGHVDDLLLVHGFDIPLAAADDFGRLQSALAEGARELNHQLVVVRTNLRQPETLWHRGWAWLTHGAGLAAVAHTLGPRYRRVLVGSSTPYQNLFPWGSHPLTDPLLSSSGLQVQHDGATFNRVEKTALVARHAFAVRNLHVCWEHQSASNCGECAKCVRTMAALSLLDASPEDWPFPRPFAPAQLASQIVAKAEDEEFLDELTELARDRGNAAVQAAVRIALRRSRRRRPLLRLAEQLETAPFLWRLALPLQRRLLR